MLKLTIQHFARSGTRDISVFTELYIPSASFHNTNCHLQDQTTATHSASWYRNTALGCYSTSLIQTFLLPLASSHTSDFCPFTMSPSITPTFFCSWLKTYV